MPSRFIRFDPDTVQLLDRCILRVEKAAAEFAPEGNDKATRIRLASALIEATRHGERDEERLVEFALKVLPAYREGLLRRTAKAGALPSV